MAQKFHFLRCGGNGHRVDRKALRLDHLAFFQLHRRFKQYVLLERLVLLLLVEHRAVLSDLPFQFGQNQIEIVVKIIADHLSADEFPVVVQHHFGLHRIIFFFHRNFAFGIAVFKIFIQLFDLFDRHLF